MQRSKLINRNPANFERIVAFDIGLLTPGLLFYQSFHHEKRIQLNEAISRIRPVFTSIKVYMETIAIYTVIILVSGIRRGTMRHQINGSFALNKRGFNKRKSIMITMQQTGDLNLELMKTIVVLPLFVFASISFDFERE